MTIEPANRLQKLPRYVFADIAKKISVLKAQGRDIIRLDMGIPDGPPPPAVIETLAQSARQAGNHAYTGYRGTAEFRRAVARFYERRFGVQLDPDSEVLPLMGSKEGLLNLCLAYLDEGDLALIPSIAYPVYARGALLSGAASYLLPTTADTGFLPQLDAIPDEIADRAKMLIVNYPNNPTGALASLNDYRRICDFCQSQDILLVSDNPYFEMTFEGYKADSVLQVAPGAIEFMSFSKSYNMSGWRLGAAVGNAVAIQTLLDMRSNGDSGHFVPIYDAGITALDETPQDWIDARNVVYQKRRDKVLDTLPSIGLQADTPQGAMYVWAKVEDGDGLIYTERVLQEAFVSLTPGIGFGPDAGAYVRFSLGIADEQLETALQRLKNLYR